MSKPLVLTALLAAAVATSGCQSLRDRMAGRSANAMAAAGITPNTNSNLMTPQGAQAAMDLQARQANK